MRRNYNPALTPDQADALDWRNYVLVSAVQAALGNISTDVRAIFIAAEKRLVTVQFVVAEGREDACVEDIDDMLAELDVLLSQTGDYGRLESEVHIEEAPRDWVQRGWPGIYWSKGWTAWRDDP